MITEIYGAEKPITIDFSLGFFRGDLFLISYCTSLIFTLALSVSRDPDVSYAWLHSGYFLVPIRLAFFWISNYVADIVSAFLATGILKMRGLGGHEGWRYLFLLEGLLTLVVGVASWFLMPPGPCETRTWFRPNGWFNERYTIVYTEYLILC